MTRDRPDGYRLSWVLSIPNAPFNGSVPFLIKDETPRDERVPRERTHRNGVSGLANLTIAVTDAAKVAGWYRVLPAAKGASIEDRDLDAAGTRFQLGTASAGYRFATRTERPSRGISAHSKRRPLSSDP